LVISHDIGYVIEILQDSLVYADHAGRGDVELDDVRLAIQARVNYSFSPPPSRETTMALAAERNKQPLPPIVEKLGVRLPPEKYCLTSINYRPLPKPAQPATKKPKLAPTPAPVKLSLTVPAAGSAPTDSSSMPPPAPKVKALFQDEENYDEDEEDDAASKKRKREDE